MPLSNGVSEEQNGCLSHVQLLIEKLSDGEFQQLKILINFSKIVSKAWKVRATDNILWKKHCTSADFLSDIPKSFKHNTLATDYYFQLYRHNVLVEQNWENFHFTQNVFQAHKEGITCISGSEDLFYTGSFDKSIKIWQLPSKKPLSTLDYHSEAVQCLALGKSILVSGSWDKTIIVYTIDNNYSIKYRLHGHLAGIISLTMFPDETLLFSGSVDKIIRIWNLQNGECLHRLGGIGGTVGTLSLIPKNPSPSSNNIIDHNEEHSQYYLVSGSNDNSILVWDLCYDDADNGNDTQKQKSSLIKNISIKKPRIIKRLEGHTRAITCLTWYKDTLEQQIESFDQENSYLEDNHHNNLVHINTSKFTRSRSASPGGTDVSEAGDYMDLDDLNLTNDTNNIIDSNDNEPQIDNDNSIEEIGTSSSNILRNNNVNNDPNVIETIRIISSSADSTIHIWDFNTGQLIGSAKDHDDIVWDLQCNSSRLVSVSSDGFIKVRSWQNRNDDNTNPSSSSSNTNNSNRKRNYHFTQSYDHEKILFAPAAALVEVDCGIKCLLMTREWLICGTEDGILIALEFQWFAYNRSPAYDVLNDILTTLTNNGPNSDQSSYSNSPTDREITVDDCNDQNENDFGNSFLCKLLPIQIDCERGAFIIGNPKTPSLLVADFSQSSGQNYKETNLDTGARMEEENIINVNSPDDTINGEYAKEQNILECLGLELNYYADVAGKVPSNPIPITDNEEMDIGNGDVSPEWGAELVFSGAQLAYGPWADRQRAFLQNFFFPPLYRNTEHTKRLKFGDTRLHTSLKIQIQFDCPFTFKVPFKENSKDWKYSQNNIIFQGFNGSRPCGWLEFKVDKNAIINITLPMVYPKEGYSNKVKILLEEIKVKTSVNRHSQLIYAKQCKCNLPSPLAWNEARIWSFDIHFLDAQIFLLRDYITLIQDLIKDWTSGPSPDQLHFIPMKYQLNPHFTNFRLYLYVNENNIIDDPADIDDNSFIIIEGSQLASNVVIPLLRYNELITKIIFGLEVTKATTTTSPKVSQTLGAFLSEDAKKFGQVRFFTVEGSYQYYNTVDPNHGNDVSLKLFGFVIRYFLILQANYFGAFINFMTLDEYNDSKKQKNHLEYIKPLADPFEVYMAIIIENGTLYLPENLYDAQKKSVIQFHELQLDLRNLDIYMDLNIYAHRLFGPLPETATYVCNWDINIDTISGQLKPSFLISAGSFAESFVYHYIDDENALPAEFAAPLYPDVVFVDFIVKEIDVSIWCRDSRTQILLEEGLNVKFDDLANEKFLQRTVVNLPDLVIRSLAMSSSSSSSLAAAAAHDINKETETHPWVEVASLECAFDVTIFRTTSGWKQKLESQQSFIKEQDKETLRVPFLYENSPDNYEDLLEKNGRHFGSLYVPPMPSPLTDENDIGSLLYNESTNSSMIDLSENQNRNDKLASFKNYGFLGHVGDDDDDSNDGMDSDSSSINDDDSTRNNEIEAQNSASDLIDDKSTPIKRSIPYGNYLRRFRLTSKQPPPSSLTSSYLRPSQLLFIPAKETGFISNDEIIDHNFKISSFSRILNENNNKYDKFFNDDDDEILINESQSSQLQPMSPITTTTNAQKATEEKTTIVFETIKPIKVLLTPIFLKIVEEFLEDVKDQNWDIEAMLDVMQMHYIGELTRLFPFKYKTISFAISIPQVYLQFIQDVLLPGDLTNANDEHPGIRTRYDISDTTLCAMAEIILVQTLLTGLGKPKQSLEIIESRANLDFDSLKLNVIFVAEPNRFRIFGIPNSMYHFKNTSFSPTSSLGNETVVLDLVLDLVLEKLKIKWIGCMQPNYFSSDLTKLSGLCIKQSPEILIGAIYWWLVFAEDLTNLLDKFKSHRTKKLQSLIYEIARFSDSASVDSDPFYLTCTLSTFRLGTNNLKCDDGWKILGRVRHCKRNMPDKLVDQLQNRLNSGNDNNFQFMTDSLEMFKYVTGIFSKCKHWKIENLSECQLFTNLYKVIVTENSDNNNLINQIQKFLTSSTNQAKLRIGNIKLSILEGELENYIDIGSIMFYFQSLYHKDVTTPSPQPLSAEMFDQESPHNSNNNLLSTSYLYIFFRFEVDCIRVDVNPDMLAFVKHWLKVHRVFASKFETLSNKGKPPNFENNATKTSPSSISKYKSATPANTVSSNNLHEIKMAKGKENKSKDTRPETSSTSLDFKNLFTILNLSMHNTISFKTITITASAQKLIAQTKLSNIHLSAWLNSPSHALDKIDGEIDSLNKSTSQSGSKGSNSRVSNSLIISAIGGIGNISNNIFEKNYSTSTGYHNTLLSIELSGISMNVVLSLATFGRPKSKIDLEPRKVLNILITLQNISFKLPQSLLKLYNFVEEWRTENLPSYDFLYKGVLGELDEQKKMISKHPKNHENHESRTFEKNMLTKNILEIKLQILLKKFSIQTHMLPSLRFQYDASDLLLVLEQNNFIHGDSIINYSGQLSNQEIRFITRNKNKGKSTSEKPINEERDADHKKAAFTIPEIKAIGKLKTCEPQKSTALNKKVGSTTAVAGITSSIDKKYSKLESAITLDLVKLSLNVNIIDNLLTAHSLLGSELNDVLDVFLFSSKRLKEKSSKVSSNLSTTTESSSSTINISSNEKDSLQYNFEISLRGLKISAASPTAVVFFETNVLNGSIKNVPVGDGLTKVEWKFSAQNFSLSLNHNSGAISKVIADDDIRKYRIAYISIDLTLQNHKQNELNTKKNHIFAPDDSSEIVESYFLKLLKVHAVMQPVALGRLIDLYLYYSGELTRRKELKESDINKLAENTRKLLQSLEVEMPKYKATSKSLLNEKVLSLEVNKFAIALPLDLHEELMATAVENSSDVPTKSQVPAFLLTATSMKFITRKWKTSNATLNDLCIQFVSEFDQGNENLFNSRAKMNRIYIPEISCEVQMIGSVDKKQIGVDSRVEGFEVDVSGNIVNYVNKLGEIYADSKERLETFTAEANLNLGSQSKSVQEIKNGNPSSINNNSTTPNVINLILYAKFIAKSGIIKLYPKNYVKKNHSRNNTFSKKVARSSHDSRGSAASLPRLNLDGIGGYSQSNLDDISRKGEQGVDTIIIPGLSLNTMYQAIIGQIVQKANDSPKKRIHIELVIHPSENILYPSLVLFFKDIIDGLKIGVQHSSDKKAIAIQDSTLPIQGLNITFYFRLSHTTFNLSCKPTSKVFCLLNWEEGTFLISSNTVEEGQSITCIGKIKGASGNIRHTFSPEDCVRAETKDISFSATLMSRRSENINDDFISIIVEFPRIMAELNIRHLQDLMLLKTICDLGQAIGKVDFNSNNIQMRTKNIPGKLKKFMISTDTLDINCEGRLVGTVNMSGFSFLTQLGIPPQSIDDEPTPVTNLFFRTERLQSLLEYEYQKILILEIDPIQFQLTDNWDIKSFETANVLIHADVKLQQIQAILAIKTVPIFLRMGNRLLALVEEKRLAAANVISDLEQTKHLNPTNNNITQITSVATPEKSINKVATKNKQQQQLTFKDLSIGGLSIKPTGKISIFIEKAHITIYPNHFHDSGCVQTSFDKLSVDMKRSIDNDERINRFLDMKINGIALLKSTCKKLKITDEKEFSFQKWFEHVEAASNKNIFTLPSTHLTMDTIQGIESNVVDHKFSVDFSGKVNVALNFGLIRYLQELKALYKEQIKKNHVGVYDFPRSPIISPVNTSSSDNTFTNIDQQQLLMPSSTTNVSSSMKSNENKDKSEIQFNPIKPVKLEPQLFILGDATPPLEWVGVQRAKIPGLVHTTITMNLDEIINQITNESFKAAQALL
ncbi:10799_t:CDS:10 [Entrophospora sp. SA101]|nr:10799_t:CDS:10 [Entrophospora sp. SA101]